MVKIDNYYLDLGKVRTLEKEERIRIFDLYRDMIHSYEEKRNIVANSFFTTLYYSGYLVDVRNEKIEELLDDDKTFNP
jgi:predicted RNA-binding protein associated with RNAse of E/G family